MEVEEWARDHASSSEDEAVQLTSADESIHPDSAASSELFVTSGPWNALHTPARDCEDAFWAAQQAAGRGLLRG